MRVTSKGQVTIPQHIREAMGIRPAETEVEFICDEQGRWILTKQQVKTPHQSRFRTAHKSGKPVMTTEQIMALTRS